ncbi:MAG: phage resistance protein [Acidimicrobiia bacterium]|nr:phage resistance protein [Acidimicrobiia bacterium]
MTLINELIDIPDQVLDGDFVLKLTEGVEEGHSAATLADYYVSAGVALAFDDALGMIAGAVRGGSSQATFLHGSFGSGKSHFMAVLHLLLQGNPQARAIPQLAPAIAHWDPVLAGKKFLLVPIHFLTQRSMDSAILGQYVEHTQRAHPTAPLPPVYLADRIISGELPGLRGRLGEPAFLDGLNGPGGGGEADEWGEYGTGTWDSARLDAALAAPATSRERQDLAAAYIAAYRPETTVEARSTGEGLIDLDNGLAAISAHARGLGYDAVVLFLDEVILWLASNIGDLHFVQRESQKLTKLVEGTNAGRPVPIVSFVARQRDLRDLVGDTTVGAEVQSFADNVELQSGRFGVITLEDRDLPAIARQRLLRPTSLEAETQLRRAVDQAVAGRADVLDTLLTTEADLELFRTVYPFSPAVVQALIAVSEALQRERTALKVMAHLLVQHRDDLHVGELIPVGDLWDVVASGDRPFSPHMRVAFDVAKRLHRERLRPMLLAQHQLAPDTAAEDPRWALFRNDDRLVKTVLLAALVDKVDAFRRLDAARLVALNWGSVRSPIPGRETQIMASKLRDWNAQVGELKVGDDPVNPSVSIALVDVDTDAIVEAAVAAFDNAGTRRTKLRSLLDSQLGGRLGGDLFTSYELLWRGTRRPLDVAFGNLRDTGEVPDAALRAAGDRPKVFIDFPLDEHGRSPTDDLDRLDRWAEQHPATRTVCWLPSFLNAAGLSALRTYVAIDELLASPSRYETHTAHLSQTQRLEARPILESRRDQLRNQLTQALLVAYGVVGGANGLVDPANSLTDHFRSLDPTLVVRPTTQPSLAGAFDELGDQVYRQLYPGHPRFEDEVTRPQLRTTWAEVARSLDQPGDDGRIVVETSKRGALRNVANALELGTMHESYFVPAQTWLGRLDRHLHQAREAGRAVTVADVRGWVDAAPGGPRGLPPEVADLVVLTVAAQTDHSLALAGRAVAPDPGRALADEVVLRPEQLPPAELWKAAVARAGGVFGVPVSERVTAAEMALLADRVRAAAAAHGTAPRELVAALGDARGRAGLAEGGARLRTAEAALDLVASLARPDLAPLQLVERLAEADIPTSDQAVALSLSSARPVMTALRDTNWDLLRSAGPEVTEPLAEALASDEFALGSGGYDAVRRRLEQEATRIVTGSVTVTPPVVTQPVVTPPVVTPGRLQRQVRSRRELDQLIDETLDELLGRGVVVEISWDEPGGRG